MVSSESRKRQLDSQTSIKASRSRSNRHVMVENGLKEEKDSKIKHPAAHRFHMDWWYEDRGSVLLLFFLYILQGIPLGLAGSIPMLLAVSVK